MLTPIGGRSWHSGAPIHWVMTELTFDDATTTGPLSVLLPPVPYGYTARDIEQFAAASRPPNP